MARLLEKYKSEILPAMMEKFSLTNSLAVPKLQKVVVNMGVGSASTEKDRLEDAARDLTLIAGQRPIVTKARKSIAGFKLRAGYPVGLKVTLRGLRMYEMLDRLISVAIPRIRDFRGLSLNAFDGRGNYSLGIGEQIVFPEVKIDDVKYVQGMDFAFVISSSNDERSHELLKLFGMPFRSQQSASEK